MKRLRNSVFIILIIGFATNTFAQIDSIYANVQGDSVTIWHTQTYRNCASRFLINYELNNFSVSLFEIDTIGQIASCLCYYDLSLRLGPLSSGIYNVDIFGTDELVGDTIYFGATTFEILNSTSNQVEILNQSQSDCYNLTSIPQRESMVPDDFKLSVYPNPFNPETNIEFYIPELSLVEIIVYDNNGRELETLLLKELERGNNRIVWDANKYSSGIYYITVNVGNKTKTEKVVLIK